MTAQFEDEERTNAFSDQFCGSTVFTPEGELLPGVDFPTDPYRGGVSEDYPQWFDNKDATENLQQEAAAVLATAKATSPGCKDLLGIPDVQNEQGQLPSHLFLALRVLTCYVLRVRFSKGFSLIELVTVIAVLGIAAAIAIQALTGGDPTTDSRDVRNDTSSRTVADPGTLENAKANAAQVAEPLGYGDVVCSKTRQSFLCLASKAGGADLTMTCPGHPNASCSVN